MFSTKKKAAQSEFWIAADQVVTSARSGFYAKLDETLESFGFAAKVREVCTPAYDKSGVGRPGIDPAVYLKMLMVGFFEDLPSERAIAARCADSIAIRQFLGYELTEATPDHSSLSIIRQRLDGPIYEQVFTLVLSALQKHGLLRGKNVGIDSSVMEANASLRGLVNRNTGAGTRVLIDQLLGGARPPGHANQPRSHNAVAAAVAQARADWGVAIEPVARLYGLGFLPLAPEEYDFLLVEARRERPAVQAFLAALRDEATRERIRALGMRPADDKRA